MTANQHTAARITYFSLYLSPHRDLCYTFRDNNNSALAVIFAVCRFYISAKPDKIEYCLASARAVSGQSESNRIIDETSEKPIFLPSLSG